MGRVKGYSRAPVPIRTPLSGRIPRTLWANLDRSEVHPLNVPHQYLDGHRYPPRALRRYPVHGARERDFAYLCQRPFRPGVSTLSLTARRRPLHQAQAPTVLDHSRALTQGDRRSRPAFAPFLILSIASKTKARSERVNTKTRPLMVSTLCSSMNWTRRPHPVWPGPSQARIVPESCPQAVLAAHLRRRDRHR